MRARIMVKDIVSLHLGQAGVQLSESIWELLSLEHDISPAGEVLIRNTNSGSTFNRNAEQKSKREGISAFFNETRNGRLSPRSIIVDCEPNVVDQIRNGKFRRLFNPNYIINGKEDAANNYARGRFNCGQELYVQSLQAVRKMAESCDMFHGIVMFHSPGGGTGSGFHALMSECLKELFGKKPILDFAIYPASKYCTSVLEPYNVVLNTSACLEHISCEFLADNGAMYDICMKKLGVDQPSYLNMNRLLAQAFSAITISHRTFNSSLNAEFTDFQTNLVPFPRVHFPIIAYAPIVSPLNVSSEYLTVQELTRAVFDHSYRFIDCMKLRSKYIACCLLYRGDVTPKDINRFIWSLKQKKIIEFVDWSPTGIKVGINCNRPVCVMHGDFAPVNKALCMLGNTSEISDTWSKLNRKFKLMADKRAFFHWYENEGMEMEEFFEAQEDMWTLEKDYQEIDVGFGAN